MKFRYDMPLWMEAKLVHFYGFERGESKYNQYHTFTKPKKPSRYQEQRIIKNSTKLQLITPNRDLSITRMADLLKQCDNIVEFYPDPYSVPGAVRTRLHNMMQRLKTVAERDFVKDYMDEEFPVNALPVKVKES